VYCTQPELLTLTPTLTLTQSDKMVTKSSGSDKVRPSRLGDRISLICDNFSTYSVFSKICSERVMTKLWLYTIDDSEHPQEKSP